MYSHDGLRDSLTNLAAPTLFYEELRRELSRVNRSGDQLSLLRFVLVPLNQGPENLSDFSTLYEVEILSFGQTLARLSRDEEVCARMGELEFVVLLFAPESAAASYIERISSQWLTQIAVSDGDSNRFEFKLLASSLTSQSGQSALDLLNCLDSQPLIPLF